MLAGGAHPSGPYHLPMAPHIGEVTDQQQGDAAVPARRVLVVEDDATLSDVVSRYLVREGFDVEVRSDGERGLARALEWLPDLVVLDVMLPGMDGLEVCRQLRSSAPIPVVMLTARTDEDDRVLGLELGADDYVTKPFSPRELTARIKAVLRRSDGPIIGTGPPRCGPAPSRWIPSPMRPAGAARPST